MSSIALALAHQSIALLPRTKRRKYSFTPAMDDAVRHAYRLFLDCRDRKAIGACAARLHVPKWMVTRRAAVLGLSLVKEPAWGDDETTLLERWGHLSDGVIQRKLRAAGFHRSVNAVHLKMKRLKIKQNLDGYSANALALALGVDGHKVTYYR